MIDRRQLLGALAASGIGTPVLHRAITALIQDENKITAEMIRQAEWISGMQLDDQQREKLANDANQSVEAMARLREMPLQHGDLPAIHFSTLAGQGVRTIHERAVALSEAHAPQRPDSDDQLAFFPVAELAPLLQTRQLRSVELTEIYLRRLKQYDPLLKCVVNLTEELAMQQATQADREMDAGHYRGPLHGIPWGAKDLISVPGYPTTWGVPQFRDRTIDLTATVAQRLAEAGTVLVAKLSLGAIAMGDRWFGGMTRSPWNPQTGSSGSSAGSAAATVAGLVGFALGSETLGSIISPCRRCGATGLRPTFGRVSRHGCMPLSWSMDKIGPIARSVEDCALVFAAIHGSDGLDPTAGDFAFQWPPNVDLRQLRIGYVHSNREGDVRDDLKVLRELGTELVEVELPAGDAPRMLADIIDVEGASVFDAMLRSNQTEGWNQWPEIFRKAQFITAVDYLRFQRLRRKLMFEFEKLMETVDVLVNTPDLFITNLTGHPSVVMPRAFRERDGKQLPYSIVFTGRLNDESRLLGLAHRYQKSIDAHLQHPTLDLADANGNGTDD